MPTQRWESCALVTEVRWRRLALRCLVHVTRASWQIVLDSWLQASSRIAQTECTHLPELLVHRANQWASMDVCDRKRGGCGSIMNYVHSAASIVHKEAKSQNERKEERSYHDQSKSRTDCQGCSHQRERRRCMSKMRPRTLCLQHRFGTDSTLSWIDSRRNTPCTLIKGMPQWSHNPWRVAEYQPYRRWKFSEWFWWPRNTSKTRRWYTKSTSFKRLGQPRCKLWLQTQLGHRNSSLSGNFSINSISTFNISSSSWRRRRRILGKCSPEDDGSTGDRWSTDTGTDRIGV